MTDVYENYSWVPIWDRKLAEAFEPLEPLAELLLIATGIFCIFMAFKLHKHPELQLLLLAFIWSP